MAFFRLGFGALGVSSLALAAPAQAHISIENLAARTEEQKVAPCGIESAAWGATQVHTFEPGQTIEIEVDEYIQHPGYFRIAFDQDGDDDFEDPETIQPIDANRRRVNDLDMDTGSDFCKNDAVLMDNLAAHKSGGGVRTFQVKLPDVECQRCTLQIIQVMEDTIHGPYNLEVGAFPLDMADLYHQCLDIKLERKAGVEPTGAWPECTIGPYVGNQVNDPNKDKYVDTGAGLKGPARTDDDEPRTSSEDGCTLAGRTNTDLGWLAVSLAFLVARRRRRVA
jgi:hypothetical protein